MKLSCCKSLPTGPHQDAAEQEPERYNQTPCLSRQSGGRRWWHDPAASRRFAAKKFGPAEAHDRAQGRKSPSHESSIISDGQTLMTCLRESRLALRQYKKSALAIWRPTSRGNQSTVLQLSLRLATSLFWVLFRFFGLKPTIASRRHKNTPGRLVPGVMSRPK